MKTIDEQTAAPANPAIDREGNPDRQATNTVSQRHAVACFDDEVEVILLHREMKDTKLGATRPRYRRAHRPKIVVDRRLGELLARIVTCTGWRGWCSGRRVCDIDGRPGFGLRPAPDRRPPHPGGIGNLSCLCRLTAILIRRMLSARPRNGCERRIL